jgi:hypothetical protein
MVDCSVEHGDIVSLVGETMTGRAAIAAHLAEFPLSTAFTAEWACIEATRVSSSPTTALARLLRPRFRQRCGADGVAVHSKGSARTRLS